MIAVLPLFVALVWLFVAAGLTRVSDFRTARRILALTLAGSAGVFGIAWIVAGYMGVDSAPTLLGRSMVVSAQAFVGLAPVMIALIGIVASALSDSISHSVATLRRILTLLAIALAFVATQEPMILGVLWLLSPLVAWSELQERFPGPGPARVFAIYQVPSIGLFLSAAGFHQAGWLAASGITAALAIGIREAVIPAHSWFPRFVEKAPMGLVVAFVAPQLGVYAHIQMLGQGLPDEVAHAVAITGATTALLAAALGVVQTSARRALAYLMMSQTGLVAFGIEGNSEVAFAGSLLAWQVLAVATSGFAMTVSSLEARRGSLSLAGHTGCFARTPRMAAGFMMMGLASVGFPMTLGFVAEDLLVQGSVDEFPMLALVLIGATALNGMNVMRAFFRLFSGRRVHSGERDLTPREAWALSIVLLTLLLGGVAPGLLTSREFGTPLGEKEHPTVMHAEVLPNPGELESSTPREAAGGSR